MHDDQLAVSIDMVRSLIDEQFPQWTYLPVTRVTGPGTVNALFRIGDGLGARLPLRGTDAAETQRQIEAEVRASRTLPARSPSPVTLRS